MVGRISCSNIAAFYSQSPWLRWNFVFCFVKSEAALLVDLGWSWGVVIWLVLGEDQVATAKRGSEDPPLRTATGSPR
jgi:hypothetical protein